MSKAERVNEIVDRDSAFIVLDWGGNRGRHGRSRETWVGGLRSAPQDLYAQSRIEAVSEEAYPRAVNALIKHLIRGRRSLRSKGIYCEEGRKSWAAGKKIWINLRRLRKLQTDYLEDV